MIISYTLMVFLMHAISEPRIISPIPATLTDTCSARLINDSAIPIIAVVTFWRIMQPNGGGQMMAIEINQDFYTDDPQIPAYGTGVVKYAGLDRIADMTKPITIEVDAVMYADGTLVGANTFGLDRYMSEKWKARDRMARGLLRFRGKEEQIKEWLDKQEDIPENQYQPNNWQYHRHQRAIVKGWAAMYSAMLKEDKSEFWKQTEKIARGEK